MARTNNIISGLSLALALSLAAASLAAAQPLTGSDFENGRVLPAAAAVRLPAGYHIGPASGSDFVNGTVALPLGAKGAEALPVQNLGDRAQQAGPMTGSDYENLR